MSVRLPYPPDDLLAPEFLQIISGAAITILRLALFAERPNRRCRRLLIGVGRVLPRAARPTR
jgi:hypothetical protein